MLADCLGLRDGLGQFPMCAWLQTQDALRHELARTLLDGEGTKVVGDGVYEASVKRAVESASVLTCLRDVVNLYPGAGGIPVCASSASDTNPSDHLRRTPFGLWNPSAGRRQEHRMERSGMTFKSSLVPGYRRVRFPLVADSFAM
ncbi:hypothetical protein PWT90_11243 [Aphanocladium album]|nr:hypothetical protein PWT90_11243 [Aphanocladium album]